VPVPFLLAGGFLFLTGPSPPDVEIVDGKNKPATTTTVYIQPTSIVPTSIDQCPPEDEPCTPGQQTTIPGTTTTTSLPGPTSTTTSTSTTSSTTTLPVTTTLPPVVDTFDIGAAASVCTNDVPFIELTFGNEPQFNGLVGTITFTTLDGDFVETVPLTYQANTTVRLVFPGASFDPVTGEATDWPGWRLNEFGFWVTDPSDAEFRDGLLVTAELPTPGGLGQSLPILNQVSATTTVTYPPETELCASPEGPFTPEGGESPPTFTIPSTQ